MERIPIYRITDQRYEAAVWFWSRCPLKTDEKRTSDASKREAASRRAGLRAENARRRPGFRRGSGPLKAPPKAPRSTSEVDLRRRLRHMETSDAKETTTRAAAP